MNKAFYILSWIGIGSGITLILLIGFWLIYPYKAVEFKNLPFPIVSTNEELVRGGRVRYFIDYCKYTNAMPTLTKYYVDGVVYETPKTIGVINEGCNTVVSDAYIPRAIPPGTYKLKIVAQYKVNPIRTIEIVSYTDQFTIK